MMILSFLSFLSACAACHICEDPAFERITSTTIVESKKVGFSGLLISLENYISFLAEKQDNTTMISGTNHSHFNLADDAVGKDVNSDTEEIFLADSWNASNLSNYSISLHSTSPDTPNYRLFHSHTPPLPESPTLVADRYLGPSATTTPSITSTITNTITCIFGLYGTIFLMMLTASMLAYCYWNIRLLTKLYIRRPIYRMLHSVRHNRVANAVWMFLMGMIILGMTWFLGLSPEQVHAAHASTGPQLPHWNGSTLEIVLYLMMHAALVASQLERIFIGRPYRFFRAQNQATRQLNRRICNRDALIRFDLRKKRREAKNRRESLLSRIEAIAAMLGAVHRETVDICAMPVVIALTFAEGLFSLARSSYQDLELSFWDVLMNFHFVSSPTWCMYLIHRYLDVSPLPGDEQVFLCLTFLTVGCSVCSVVSQVKANRRIH